MFMGRSRSEPTNDHFPAHASRAEQLRFLLQYAVLAPSRYNAQPWLWEVDDDALRLYPDYNRELLAVDFNGRETLIGCGAALFHLRVALRFFGFADDVAVLPDPRDPDLLAYVRLGLPTPPTEADRELFHAIGERHTNRQRFVQQPVPNSVLHELSAAAEREGAWLHMVTPEQRTGVANLIAEGDQLHWSDPDFRREYADWHHRSTSDDGLRSDPLGLRSLVIRRFDLGERQAEHDRQLAETAPALVVLGTGDDTRVDWLNTGQALAHVLLRAQVTDMSASFLNQPIEHPQLRRELARQIQRRGFPQIMLRMGLGPQVPATARRPLDDVVL